MNGKSLLVLWGLVLGCSACMGSPRPAPDTGPMPVSSSIAEHAGVEARRLEAERRTGVIFETSRPGQLLIDGQAPVVDGPSEKATDSDKKTAPAPESVSKDQSDAEESDSDQDDPKSPDASREEDGTGTKQQADPDATQTQD